MSIKPLGERLDAMAMPDTTPVDVPQPIIPPDPALVPEEGVQVAGKIEGLRSILKGVQEATKPVETQPAKRVEQAKEAMDMPSDVPVSQSEINAAVGNQPIRVEGSQIVVEPASAQDISRIQQLISVQKTEGKPPQVRPNLDRIQSEDEIKQTYLAIVGEHRGWVDEQRRAGRTFKDIIDDAEKNYGDAKLLKDLITRQPGDRPFNDWETLAARIAVLDLQQITLESIKKAGKTNSDRDLLEAARLMSFDGQASASLLGAEAELGRALAINRIMINPANKERVKELRKTVEQFGIEDIPQIADDAAAAAFLEQMGGKNKVGLALAAYEQLPNSAAKAFYSKTILRSSLESASEIYQSALISGVQTHWFNFLGSPIHFSMITAERFASAIAGKDEALMEATFASLRAFPRYWTQAMAAGAHAFKTEASSDMVNKFAQNRLATTATNFGVDPATPLGKSIDYFGQAMRFPGFRLLGTVDESYKAMFRGMEMEFIATNSATKAALKLVDSGGSQEEAARVAADVYRATINSPTSFEDASEFARVMTFQDALQGDFLGKMQEIMSHPIAKLSGFPFFKTITQIGLRGMERTPLAAAMPRFWKALNSDDPQVRNMALAKVGVSGAIGSSLAMIDFVTDGAVIMTGHGPHSPDERRAWLERNEPYSFGFRQKDGSYKFLSFKRYEPGGQQLGFWADTRDTIAHINDPEVEEQLWINMALTSVNYIIDSQPSLQFISEISDVFGSQDPEDDRKMERILQIFQKQATSSALVVGQSVATGGVAPVGITNTVEKIMENAIKSKVPREQYDYAEIPGWRMSLRASYEAIAEARARSSYFNNKVFGSVVIRETNEWYEPVRREFDGWMSAVNSLPLQVKAKRGNIINEEMVKLKGGFPKLSKTMNEPGVMLNDIQWDRYKELVNYPERSAYYQEYFGDIKIPTLMDSLISEINSPQYNFSIDEYGNEIRASAGQKLEKLRAVRSSYVQNAKQLMLLEFPNELGGLIEQRKLFEDAYGKSPRKLPLTPETLEEIGRRNYNPR
jgi:hypothetical protein